MNDINIHHLKGPLTINRDRIKRKNIDAPMYAGASRIG